MMLGVGEVSEKLRPGTPVVERQAEVVDDVLALGIPAQRGGDSGELATVA